MTQTNEENIHTCAKCGTQVEEQQAITNEYKCPQCEYELAHLDVAANGATRGIFGWLKEKKAEIGGRYLVETVLGKGGFGATYLVSDQRVHGKRWALKEIPEMLFDEYEVSLLSQLDHPSVPIIVDRFVDKGMVYLVLKFGGSRTLASECKKNKQIAYAALKPWIFQIANVLEYLHSRNPPIIHRDLKPENILIDDENRVMLIDFGIAKESVAASFTRTLGRAASHGFSPPEQVMGTGTDVRSDIYSLAATIYFALVGKTPVAAHERVAGAVLQTPSELVSGIPAEVNAILMKSLSLNINERPRSVTDFLAVFTGVESSSGNALDSSKTIQISDIQFGPVVTEGPTRATPSGAQTQLPNQQNNKSKLIGAVVVVAAVSAGGAYWFMNNRTDDSLSNEPSRIEAVTEQPSIEAAIEQPSDLLMDSSGATAITPPSELTSAPSALDILNENLDSKKDPFQENKKKVEPVTKVATEAKTKVIPEKAPVLVAPRPREEVDWDNQQQGSF